MQTQIISNLTTYCTKKSLLILALSGGSDSVCLLDILAKNKFNVILAHLNHSLRKNDSKLDEDFCKKLARKYKLPIETKKINVKKYAENNKLNLEEAGRTLRYEFFKELKEKHKAKYILTAHHLNDNIETVLLNLTRGASIRGLKGMEIKSLNLLRPMLNTTKTEILKYIKKHKLSYRADKSNLDEKFKRNLIRNKIIPVLKKINPKFETQMINFINSNRALFDYFEKKAINWLKTNYENQILDNRSFLQQTDHLQKQILSSLYAKLYKSTQNLTNKHLEEFINLIKTNKTNTQKQFGKKYCLKIEYNKTKILKFKKPLKHKKHQPYPQELKPSTPLNSDSTQTININNKTYKIITKTEILKNSITDFKPTSLSLDNISEEKIFVRSWQHGDKINPLGMKNSKKLQDIFTNLKIPNKQRKEIPIFTNKKDHILAIGDLIISETHKITPKTKKIIKIKISPLN